MAFTEAARSRSESISVPSKSNRTSLILSSGIGREICIIVFQYSDPACRVGKPDSGWNRLRQNTIVRRRRNPARAFTMGKLFKSPGWAEYFTPEVMDGHHQSAA